VVVLVIGAGTGASAVATTGPYAPIHVFRPTIYTEAGTLLNDPEAALIPSYLGTAVSKLPGLHRYRVTVTNTSNLGFIDSLQWYPPPGVHITRVIGSSVGDCAATGLTGFGGNQFKTVLLYPNISCDRVGLKPPSCTCQGNGGSVSVSFVVDRAFTGLGSTQLTSARLVLHPILSYQKPQAALSGQGSPGG
jgi:hypothetical protein